MGHSELIRAVSKVTRSARGLDPLPKDPLKLKNLMYLFNITPSMAAITPSSPFVLLRVGNCCTIPTQFRSGPEK